MGYGWQRRCISDWIKNFKVFFIVDILIYRLFCTHAQFERNLKGKGPLLFNFINPDLVPFRFGIAHIVYSILLRLFIYFDNIIVMHSLYLEEGFLHLQNAVSLAIIEAMANKTIDIKVSVEVSVVFSNSNTCIHVHVLSQLSSYLMVIFKIIHIKLLHSNFPILHMLWTTFILRCQVTLLFW